MAKVERSTTINAQIEKVFSYITNPSNDPEWQPGAIEVRDITGQGVGQRYGWTYKIMGISLKGASEVIEYIPNQRYVYRSTGGVVSTWTYNFKAEGGGTQIDIEVEYTIPVPVLGKFPERMVIRGIEREADFSVEALKDILEG